jgi:hypothetical protein
LNLKDGEDSTAVFYAFRSNHQEIVHFLLGHPQVDIDIMSPKYGCVLHLCILKHWFDLAVQLLENLTPKRTWNPHILNPNGSNAVHIMFANFQQGEASKMSTLITNKLIQK